jgi:hypothetical protein
MTAPLDQLHRQRCFHHAEREAVAQCPPCQHYYCRECITEHNSRVMCKTCLNALTLAPPARGGIRRIILAFSQFLLGFVLLWILFTSLGQFLIALPSSFHEGTVWQEKLEPY